MSGGEKIAVGVSACLLGEAVRYDGGHKFNGYVVDTLGKYFRFEPLCPEVSIGLGVPREPIQLVADRQGIHRAVGVRDPRHDVTDSLQGYGRETAARLPHLRGYIFKSKSPSCGLEPAEVQGCPGGHEGRGRGLYAAAIVAALPRLPVVDEIGLADEAAREAFIEQVYVYHRWSRLAEAGFSAPGLREFHERHKLVVMAHSQQAYRGLGRLAARIGTEPLRPLSEAYAAELMAALRKQATAGAHANVLQHLMGYLKKVLSTAEKAELLASLEAFRLGLKPRSFVLGLLGKHFLAHPHPYVARQYYLSPYPAELMGGALDKACMHGPPA